MLLKRRFLVSLLLGTWVPIVFFILLAPPVGASGSLASLKAVFLFLGTRMFRLHSSSTLTGIFRRLERVIQFATCLSLLV